MTTKERNYGLKKKCDELQHENKVLKRAFHRFAEMNCEEEYVEEAIAEMMEQAEKEVKDE